MFGWLGFKKLLSKTRFENLFFKNKKRYFCFKKHNFKIKVFETKMEKQYQTAPKWTWPEISQPSPSPTRSKLGLGMGMPWPGP